MEDQNKTKEELINELRQLRKRITEVEALERERKQAKDTARESGERLRLLADSLPVLISYVDSEQRYHFNSKAYERWFGQSPTEICGKHIKDVLGETAYQTIQPYVKAALSGQEVTFERKVPYQDGGTRYASGSYIPHFGDQGEVKGFFALLNDITEQKTDRGEIKETPRPPRRVGRIFTDFVPPKQLPEDMRSFEETLASGKPVIGFENRVLKKDETVVFLLAKAIVVRDEQGNPIGTTGTSRDITENKQAEEAFRESKERFRTILREPVGIGLTDLEGRILNANPALLQILGYGREELIGKSILEFTHPDDVEKEKQSFQQFKQRKSHSLRFEKRYVRKDGASICANLTDSLYRDDKEAPPICYWYGRRHHRARAGEGDTSEKPNTISRAY